MGERRRHPRYRAREGAYAVVKDGEHLTTRILDISAGGVSLLYSSDSARPRESSVIDLLFAFTRFRIKDFPFEAISDTEVPDQIPSTPGPLRRLGGKFGDLSENQVSELNFFIRNYTVS